MCRLSEDGGIGGVEGDQAAQRVPADDAVELDLLLLDLHNGTDAVAAAGGGDAKAKAQRFGEWHSLPRNELEGNEQARQRIRDLLLDGKEIQKIKERVSQPRYSPCERPYRGRITAVASGVGCLAPSS